MAGHPERSEGPHNRSLKHAGSDEDQPLFVRSFTSFRMTTQSNRRLLLRKAMKCAKSPNQFAAIYPDNATIRKTFAQDRPCDFVSGIGEPWRKHASICDVEIRIRSRQPQAFAHDLLRHRERNDVERAS